MHQSVFLHLSGGSEFIYIFNKVLKYYNERTHAFYWFTNLYDFTKTIIKWLVNFGYSKVEVICFTTSSRKPSSYLAAVCFVTAFGWEQL